jgi:hypothetical protein
VDLCRVNTKTPFLNFAESENKQKFAHFSQNFAKFCFAKIFVKFFAKTKIFSKTFTKAKIFAKRNFAKFRENLAIFRLFLLFAKIKKGVFVAISWTFFFAFCKKSCENFRVKFCFRKNFRENFCFRKNFRFLKRFRENFCFNIFAKISRKFFSLFAKKAYEKLRKLSWKFSRHFRENTKTKILVSTLDLC